MTETLFGIGRDLVVVPGTLIMLVTAFQIVRSVAAESFLVPVETRRTTLSGNDNGFRGSSRNRCAVDVDTQRLQDPSS